MNPKHTYRGSTMELTKENYIKLRDTKKYTRPQMAREFNIPDWKIKKWIAAEGLGITRPTLKNPRAFQHETRDSSYWAGFIAADGCVDEKGRVRFYLQLSDHNHLAKFAEFVGSTHKLNLDEKRNRCSIEFTSRAMVKDLLRWSITPRKSVTYTPPTDLAYLRHFLRGMIDGDGTICESFSNVNSITATLYAGIVCSYNFRDWFVPFCNNVLDITLKQHERENCVCITMNTNKSKTFLTYLYSNTNEETRLTRKFALYDKIVVQNIRKTRVL
jgi:hypothetical protein